MPDEPTEHNPSPLSVALRVMEDGFRDIRDDIRGVRDEMGGVRQSIGELTGQVDAINGTLGLTAKRVDDLYAARNGPRPVSPTPHVDASELSAITPARPETPAEKDRIIGAAFRIAFGGPKRAVGAALLTFLIGGGGATAFHACSGRADPTVSADAPTPIQTPTPTSTP